MNELIRTEYCQALISKIAGFRSNDRFCDIDVHVDGRVFKCHRLILSAASEYFNVMFNGNFKESKATEVTLRETTANLFERILTFMYTGKAPVVHESDVLDMIRVAEFYKLPSVIEMCADFVEKNLNSLADRILEMFSFARSVGMERLVKPLSRHVYQNFAYFSSTPEFAELSVDDLSVVLNLLEADQPAVQDAFLEGVHSWITQHHADLTAEEIRSYSRRLLKKVSLKKLSLEYTDYRMERSLIGGVSSRSDADDDVSIAINAFRTRTSSLHACISRISQDGVPAGTSIFTAYLNKDNSATHAYTWVYSRELECSADFMRNITVDGRLYSLKYSKKSHDTINGPQQTFSASSSMWMYPYLSLKPPPLILDEFDLCGNGNNIYTCSKNPPLFPNNTVLPAKDSGFTREELSNGLYAYKGDVDRWFPLPCPKQRFVNTCMTCDEEMIYLIGGLHSDKCVQAYDPRAQKWSILTQTRSTYIGAACCASGRKIYVAGGQLNPTNFEVYDPVSGNWRRLKNLPKSRSDEHQLVNWCTSDPSKHSTLVSYRRTLSIDSSSILTYGSSAKDEWFSLPNLFDVVSCSNLPFTNNLCILDMVYTNI